MTVNVKVMYLSERISVCCTCLCRDVSRLWNNEGIGWQGVQTNESTSNGVANAAAASQELNEEEEEEVELGQADMFADYRPSKCI